jgi:type VI secretion system protein ImpC
MTNIQNRLSQVRPPRVSITYEAQTDGAIVTKELPFCVGIIANLTGDTVATKEYKDRRFVTIDANNITDIMSKMSPSVFVKYSINLSSIGEQDIVDQTQINFTHIDNFSPDHLIQSVSSLSILHARVERLIELRLKIQNNDRFAKVVVQAIKTNTSVTDVLKNSSIVFTSEFLQDMDTAVNEVHALYTSTTEHIDDQIIIKDVSQHIARLESIIGTTVTQILHQRSFQQLEGTWRGIIQLIRTGYIGYNVQLKIFDCKPAELLKDLNSALEFDQSHLFYQVYEEQYGTYGGTPFNIIGVDQYVGYDSQSIALLNKLSQVSAAAHTVCILGVSPGLFDLDNFTGIYKLRDISKLLQSKNYIQFRAFREAEEAKYVGLVMPRYMARLPYDPVNNPISKIPSYTENLMQDDLINVNDHNKYCWSNSIYAYLGVAAKAFVESGWFGNIAGPENGGEVCELNISMYMNEDNERLVKCPTETVITDRKEKELSDHGIISLCYCRDTNKAVFFSNSSCYKPASYNSAEASSSAYLCSILANTLNVGRFAHIAQVMARNKIGCAETVESLQMYFNEWISSFVLVNDTQDRTAIAIHPLRAARILVADDPFRPGCYKCSFWLQPRMCTQSIAFHCKLVSKIGE